MAAETTQYHEGDTFDVNDISSQYHEWNGTVRRVEEDGSYFCMVDRFVSNGAYITFDNFVESQMASKVYVEDIE